MTTQTPTQRIGDLEAEAFRTSRAVAEMSGTLALVRGGLDELSGDVRAIRQEQTEAFQQVNGRLDRIEAAVTAIAAKLEVATQAEPSEARAEG